MSFQYDVSHSKLVNGFSTFQKHWPLAACSCFSVYACSCRDDWPPAARSHANKTRSIIRKLWSSERWTPIFCGRRQSAFAWSPHFAAYLRTSRESNRYRYFFCGRRHCLRLTCGPAGSRTTTGSLSASSRESNRYW